MTASVEPPRPRRLGGLMTPAVIAHRGARMGCLENTLDAFNAAMALGADMVEMDIRLTADGVPVVAHDPIVTTSKGEAAVVCDLTLTELRADPALSEIATLRDVLTQLSGRCAAEIEIKHLAGEPGSTGLGRAAANAVAALIAELSFDAALVSCFEAATLDEVRRALPTVSTGLETEGTDGFAQAVETCARDGHTFVLPDVAAVLASGQDLIDHAHTLGLFVATWVADDAETLEALFAMGVDAIESDDPQTAIAVRDAVRQRRGSRSDTS